jgi:glycosyltransferase involved in cell wall biosynthesis
LSGLGSDGQIVPQHLVLVLPSTGEFDSRAWRIARTLTGRGHTVTMLARWKAGLPVEEYDPLGFRLLRIRASAPGGTARPRQADPGAGSRLGRAWRELRRRTAVLLAIRSHRRNAVQEAPAGDLYHGMMFMGIPVALDLGKRDRVPVVYDARDIYLSARNLARMGALPRALLGRLERGWAKRASRVVTVNDAYADVMARRWLVERPLVVMNCSFRYTPPSPRVHRFHQHLGLDPAEKVVLYHGGLSPWRGIEQLIAAIPRVPGATLVLMGYGDLEETLRAREADPASGGKIRVMTAVPPGELHDWVAAADVAAMPIQGDTLNHRLTTPNKLFEAMAAGVPAVVSDLPGMRAIVEDTGCGILVDPTDPHAIADGIRQVLQLPDEGWLAWRQRCLDAAHDRYNWETQVETLLHEYGRLTGKRW